MQTITALATPPGIGGIAVIRISGDNAIEIVDKCFISKKSLLNVEPQSVTYGRFHNNNTIIDTVLATVFRKPNSYTGENTVEISCHGGIIVAGEIIQTILNNGAILAEPGEFTKRAFLNGKLDLTQVEAVADLIHASSIPAVYTSARQLTGEFTHRLKIFRSQLIEIAGLLELELDFSEEDIELTDRAEVSKRIENAIVYCDDLASSYRSSEILRSGYFVGIAGYPNAGKSMLFNALLQRKRAIVSETPGTTRDYIEENIMIEGINIRLIDTAGLRETSNIIEIEGIKLVETVLKQSNLILILNDISIQETYSDNLYKEIKLKYPKTEIILVQNKIDLLESAIGHDKQVCISAKRGDGISELKMRIAASAKNSIDRVNDILLNQRQANILKQSSHYLQLAYDGIKSNYGNELISMDIRNAAIKLGEITGESWSEEVLNSVFGNFCIGK